MRRPCRNKDEHLISCRNTTILGLTHWHFSELGVSFFGKRGRRQSQTRANLGEVSSSTIAIAPSVGSKKLGVARVGVGVNQAAMGISVEIEAGVNAALALAGAVLFVSVACFHPDTAPERLVFFFEVWESIEVFQV